MADTNLNAARSFINKSVMHDIRLTVYHMICMHMYNLREKKLNRSILLQLRGNNMIIRHRYL